VPTARRALNCADPPLVVLVSFTTLEGSKLVQ
jgi:hypothetical protein